MEKVLLVKETVGECLRDNRIRYPDDPAFIFDDVTYTWKETGIITDHIAVRMIGDGVDRGMHVGFWSLNTVQLVFYMLAAMKIGAVSAVINYSYRTFELGNVLRKADIERLYLGENKRGSDYNGMAGAVREKCEKLKAVEHMEAGAGQLRKLLEKGELTEAERSLLSVRESQCSSEDVVSITFTSGTTTVPKPVMLTHYNILNNARQFAAIMHVSHENGDVLSAPLPLFHCSGLTGMLCFALTAGIPAVIQRMFRADETLRAIGKYRVTTLMAVPSMLEMMAAQMEREHYDVSSLRIGQTSGAGITPAKLRWTIERLGFEHFTMAYGQTECSPLITATRYDDDWSKVLETAGRPLPYVNVRIWNLEEDQEADTLESGEIQVRGFNTMKGYYHCAEEQAEKFTKDGWLKTTDAGYLDEEGYLHFVTRISDVIIRHGENISAAEIESVVQMASPDIVNVKVVGVAEELVQEEIACLVQCRCGEIDTEALRDFIRSMLASYKVPKYIFQIGEFPMTPTGKIDQTAAKQLAVRLCSRMEEKR